jgi:hypothetical protein
MFIKPLSEAFATNLWQDIRLIATDMDGTITQKGKFSANLLHALEALRQAKIDVLIVTGRSAGWVNAIQSYLPITAAIAENGGLFYSSCNDRAEFLTKIDDLNLHRQKLAETFRLLQSKFPQIQESSDNCFRLSDWTFDVEGLNLGELEIIENICQQEGWGFTYSTVQCHIKPIAQNKASSLLQVLAKYFPQLTTKQIITVGDSPNDESLFDRSVFPFSVGVANVLHYVDRLKNQPAYVTNLAESEGFCELVKLFTAK